MLAPSPIAAGVRLLSVVSSNFPVGNSARTAGKSFSAPSGIQLCSATNATTKICSAISTPMMSAAIKVFALYAAPQNRCDQNFWSAVALPPLCLGTENHSGPSHVRQEVLASVAASFSWAAVVFSFESPPWPISASSPPRVLRPFSSSSVVIVHAFDFLPRQHAATRRSRAAKCRRATHLHLAVIQRSAATKDPLRSHPPPASHPHQNKMATRPPLKRLLFESASTNNFKNRIKKGVRP